MKRLSEYIYFVHSQHETQDKCILRGLLRQNPVIPPHDPLKYGKVGGEAPIVKLNQVIF